MRKNCRRRISSGPPLRAWPKILVEFLSTSRYNGECTNIHIRVGAEQGVKPTAWLPTLDPRLSTLNSQYPFCPILHIKTGIQPPQETAVTFEGVTLRPRGITTYDNDPKTILKPTNLQNQPSSKHLGSSIENLAVKTHFLNFGTSTEGANSCSSVTHPR
jgi:hypothetical protein